MVISHSCEIALENALKITSIILAPTRDVNQATSADKIRELIESNLIDPAGTASSFLKYFYLEPHPGLQFPNGAVVDFSKCFSVRKQSYDTLLQNKIAQLNQEITFALSLKLALYFHRSGRAQIPVAQAVPLSDR